MEEIIKNYKFVIALEFFTNSGVKNEKCGQQASPSEIIQCFSVILDVESGEVVEEYDRIIRPEKIPILSDACKELTGLTQVKKQNSNINIQYSQSKMANG
jgi:inhibitor of KinA sporulation pathway (predicted exonuclease)